jgi:hypothetical protein
MRRPRATGGGALAAALPRHVSAQIPDAISCALLVHSVHNNYTSGVLSDLNNVYCLEFIGHKAIYYERNREGCMYRYLIVVFSGHRIISCSKDSHELQEAP